MAAHATCCHINKSPCWRASCLCPLAAAWAPQHEDDLQPGLLSVHAAVRQVDRLRRRAGSWYLELLLHNSACHANAWVYCCSPRPPHLLQARTQPWGWQQAPPCLLQPTPNPATTRAVSARTHSRLQGADGVGSKRLYIYDSVVDTPGLEQASRKQASANPPPQDVLNTVRCLRCFVGIA